MTHFGICAAHEVGVEDGLAHVRGDEHGLDAVPAAYFFRDRAGEVADVEVLEQRARRGGDLLAALEALGLDGARDQIARLREQ